MKKIIIIIIAISIILLAIFSASIILEKSNHCIPFTKEKHSCNSCTCTSDFIWICTKMACPIPYVK